MDYKSFDVDDFILDEAFVLWVRSNENDDFWQDFILSNPEQGKIIVKAREVISAASSLPAYSLPEAEKKAMFENINQRIQEDEEDHAESRPLFRRFWWAAAAVILLAGWWSWYTPGNKTVTYEKLVSAQVKESDLEEAVNTADKPLLVNLPDGSSVLLLKGSRLSFNKGVFNQTKREVYLSGEAFFEVAKNQEKPFFVYANELVTKVLGTSFTIRAFENSKNVEVVVKTGKVSVFTQHDPEKENKLKDHKLEGLVLLPNEQIVLERAELKLFRSKIEKPELLVLPAQKLTFEFDDVPFEKVVATIERAYGVEIVFDKELLGKCRLTAYLSDEPLKDKIRMICDALSAKSEVVDGKIHIKASACR